LSASNERNFILYILAADCSTTLSEYPYFSREAKYRKEVINLFDPTSAPGDYMTNSMCVVTGGAGFIGCALSGGLVQRFENVIVLDKLHPQIHAIRKRPISIVRHQ
jgi:hypothetical protein